MMGVTITNLGYGDFTPSFWLSRIITSILSLSGIFQTALIVGVLRIENEIRVSQVICGIRGFSLYNHLVEINPTFIDFHQVKL